MRSLIVLCLVAVACADKLGYNYQPVEHSDAGLSFAPGTGAVGGGEYLAPAISNQGDGGNYGSSLNAAPQGDYTPSTNDGASFAPQPEFEKEFFTYTANEADFNDPANNNQYANDVKQSLRVVFIKGPESNGLENAAINLAKQAVDQKTDIYVLNKQADLDGLSNKLNNINKNNNNKPEVHFVKYRTPQDAANAQNAIQGQYDALGGPSQSFNGGVAPVLNFASKAAPAPVSYNTVPSAPATSYNTDASGPATNAGSSYIPPATPVDADELSNTYLPANILRLFRL